MYTVLHNKWGACIARSTWTGAGRQEGREGGREYRSGGIDRTQCMCRCRDTVIVPEPCVPLESSGYRVLQMGQVPAGGGRREGVHGVTGVAQGY